MLQVGGQLQLETLTALTDGTQEVNRADIAIAQQGSATSVNGQRLLTATQPGADQLTAVVPPLPQLPGPAVYSYRVGGVNHAPSDYSKAPYEVTAIVVNRPWGLSFSAQPTQTGIGTIIAKTPTGIIGVERDQNYLYQSAFPNFNKTPNTTGITALAAGNFTTGTGVQMFFAGRSWGLNGADYAVAVPGVEYVPPYSIPRPVTLYTEYRDGAVTDAVVADFNGDGKSDAALVIQNQMLVRLTGTAPLSELKSTIPLGFIGTRLKAADLNGDQNVDLVVGGPGGLQIFLGDGTGNFAARPLFAALPVTDHLNVGDIDGDQNLDVTYMNSEGFGNRNWVVAYGDGQGSLGRVRTGSTGFRIAASDLADMNGDGRADLVTVQSKSQRTLATDSDVSVSIHPGSSEGFLPQQVIQVSSNFSGADLVLRDINGDGLTDITLALTQRSTLLGQTIYNRSSAILNLLRQP